MSLILGGMGLDFEVQRGDVVVSHDIGVSAIEIQSEIINSPVEVEIGNVDINVAIEQIANDINNIDLIVEV